MKRVMKIEGPSYWELATVHAKELLGDDTIGHICKLCVQYGYRPWGFFSSNLEFIVVVSDPDTIADVFKNPNTSDKSSFMYGGLKDYVPNGSLVTNGPQWKWHRKTISPAFRKYNMDARLDILGEGAEELVGQFREKADGPSFDISHILDISTADTTLKFITNNIQVVPSVPRFCEAVEEGMNLAQSQTLNPFYHWYKMRFDKRTREKEKLAREVIKETGSLFREAKITAKNRMSNRLDPQPADVMECLASAAPEPGITEQDLVDEVITMAVGGMETTRNSMKTLMFLLALYPDVQQRLYEEQETIMGQRDRPTPQDIQDMKYMDAVIKEALRLYPSIPLIGRAVNKTSTIGGVTVPKGACVIINVMAMQRNPVLFHDPEKFLPERFIGEVQDKRHPYSYIPFGAGQRTCVGYAQGTITMKIMMGAVLRNFKIIPAENVKSMDDFKIKMSITITIREPKVKLISRHKNVAV